MVWFSTNIYNIGWNNYDEGGDLKLQVEE